MRKRVRKHVRSHVSITVSQYYIRSYAKTRDKPTWSDMARTDATLMIGSLLMTQSSERSSFEP